MATINKTATKKAAVKKTPAKKAAAKKAVPKQAVRHIPAGPGLVRIRMYREAAQQSIGNVTGLLGEVFGAALAVKLAGAEEHVVTHLRMLNESRRRATLADRVFTEFVRSASNNVANALYCGSSCFFTVSTFFVSSKSALKISSCVG